MPAGKTYTKIASQTTTGSVQTVTFSNLPQNFTDLVCVMQVVSSSSNTLFMRFNSNTGSNYSATRLSGSGTSALSDRDSNATYGLLSNYAYPTSTAGNTNTILQIPNYSNTTINKTFLVRSNAAGAGVDAIVGLWRQTSAIDSISFSTNGFTSSTSISSGSIFTIYGIAASKAPQAIGGTITTDGSYWIHTFTSSGLFIPQQSINNVDYLVVAGGGGAAGETTGGGGTGGGGAGGVRTGSFSSLSSNTNYSVTVGAGGSGGSNGNGSKGSNSVFSTITSTGGGNSAKGANGATGGSGGGGSFYQKSGGAGNEGSYTPVEGYAGGSISVGSGYVAGAGGGGASAVGANVSSFSVGSNGGNGVASSISGSSVTYGGGGGGGGYEAGSVGGSGGGGNGSASSGGSGSSGTANRGGGGGGGYATGSGGSGGSGIVIVRYPI